MRFSTLVLFAIIAASLYLLYNYRARIFLFLEGENLSYTSCPCCCESAESKDPEFHCLYYGKGDRINLFVKRDREMERNCRRYPCGKPVIYAYCDP